MGGVTINPQPVTPYRPEQQDLGGNLMQMRLAQGREQLQQGQQQIQQQQIQSNQMDIESTKAFHKAYMEAQGDPDKTTQLAAKYGAKPEALQAWSIAATKQKEATLDLVSKQGAEAARQANLMQGAHDTVAAADPKDRPALYQQQLAQLNAAKVDTSQAPQQYPGDELFKFMGVGLKAHTEQVADLLKQSEVNKNTAQAGEATQKTAESQLQETRASQLAPATLAKTQAEAQSAAQKARLGPGGIAAAEAAGKVRGEMNAMGAMGGGGPAGAPNPNLPAGQRDDAYLNTLNGNVKTTVQAIAEGRIPLPSGFALKSPYWQNMLAMVSKYDPSFDAVNYNARSQTRKAFTSGQPAQQVNAINTAIGHLDQLSSAVDKLGNTNFPAANSIKNWFSQETGDPKVTNFKTIVKPVADELTRVWRGTGGSEKDIQDRLNALSSSGSPEQLHQAISEIGDLMKSKLDALGGQYGQGMGTAPVKMITPQAEQVLGRLTQKAGGGSQPAPAGQPMTATGPNGHKIMVKDGKWVDAQTGAPIQ